MYFDIFIRLRGIGPLPVFPEIMSGNVCRK